MPSSWSSSLRFELQFTGENINLWGDKLNAALAHADYAVAGWLTKPLSGNAALSTANAGDDEARAAMIKFTGAGPFAVTIPSVSKAYLIWNACAGAVTLTTGAGSTVTVDPGDIVQVFCDGSNVKTPGYGGYNLKDYIASMTATAGAVPGTTGSLGKFLKVTVDAGPPTWQTLQTTDIGGFSATTSQVWTGTSAAAALTPASLSAAMAPQTVAYAATTTLDLNAGLNFVTTLTGNVTLANPTNLQVGDSGIITIKQDATGSRTWAVGTGWKFPGGLPALSTAASAVDTVAYYVEDAATPVIRAVLAKAYA